MLNEYKASIYDGLRDFSDVSDHISEIELDVQILSRLIVAHGLEDLVCLSLLHKHFDLGAEEKLVEELSERSSTLRPESIQSHFLVPCFWKVSDCGQPAYSYDPLEFVRRDRPEGERALININSLMLNQLFLTEFARTVLQNNLEDTFGLSLVRREHLRPQPDEYLLESTNESERILSFAIRKIEATKASGIVPTMWKFGADGTVSFCGHCSHPVQ